VEDTAVELVVAVAEASSARSISPKRSGSTLKERRWTDPTWWRSGAADDPRSSVTKKVILRPSPVSKERCVESGSSRLGWRSTRGIPGRSR
jgi:hypothetical protein